MHPRNPYRDKPPDFAALARRHPCFARHVHGAQAQLDWGDPAALVELSRALLLEDFGVHWDIPPDRLCPTIPSRLNYLLWIEDLLALRAATPAAGAEAAAAVVGVDIGTGASCVYPLLGAARHADWRFVATEIDPASVEVARANVSRNGWEGRVDVRHVVAGDGDGDGAEALPPILCGVLQPDERADFCMYAETGLGRSPSLPPPPPQPRPALPRGRARLVRTDRCNPPFWSPEEVPRARRAPYAACTATRGEMFTAGGEVGFVERIVADSAIMGERVRCHAAPRALGRT